jgi:hypothetical protein
MTPGGARPRDPHAYNRLQAATYLAVVFVLLPLVILTGLSMSPAVMAAVPVVDLFGGHQSARTIHFLVSVTLVLFFAGHLGGVPEGRRTQDAARSSDWGPNSPCKSSVRSRRRFIGIATPPPAPALVSPDMGSFPITPASSASASDRGASLLANSPGTRSTAARSRRLPAIKRRCPKSRPTATTWRTVSARRLTVDGSSHPGGLSSAAAPSLTDADPQHVCEQGWSAIAEWTRPAVDSPARHPAAGEYVFFTTVDDWWDSLDMMG